MRLLAALAALMALAVVGNVAVLVHRARHAHPTPAPMPPAPSREALPPQPRPPASRSSAREHASLSSVSLSSTPRPALHVPRLIHQSWRDEGFPKTLFNWRWQEGLVRLNPGWVLQRWTDASARALIATHYPWFLEVYDGYPSYIQRCDASRYFILYHHGGVYADLDIECFRPFAPAIADARVVLSYKQGTNMTRGLANAIFATEAQHPFWSVVFELLVNRSAQGLKSTTHVDVIRSTGPGLLREAVEVARRQRVLEKWGVSLLPSRIWHPIMPEQKRGRDTSAEALAAINASFCYHHFVSSWVAHDQEKHKASEQARGGAQARAVVPVGQQIRETNPWRSYPLELDSTKQVLSRSSNGKPEARASRRKEQAHAPHKKSAKIGKSRH
ncbi:hypothetical protein AB1Y20_001331 [Prymnesium parvum]|uniref:Alpha-1,4-N-acetylglucosaminyltransferase n=1 Tax=Prymnesium parvum TaxID=97485 RepID=A0AB34KBQ6_PRYPA